VSSAALDTAVDVAPGLPVTANLTCYRGDSWTQTFRLLTDGVPVDLAGYTLAAECRNNSDERYPLAAYPGADPGEVTIAFPAGEYVDPGDYRYDLELTDTAGVVTTWVTGRMNVRRDVTNEQPE
jgi:hypothetical protein